MRLRLQLQPQCSVIQAALLKPSPSLSTSVRWMSPRSAVLPVRCTQQDAGGGGGLKSAISNIVDKGVEELLAKEENKELLDNLNKASERVELAREELANIERQQNEAIQMKEYITLLQNRASQIEECQMEVLEARKMLEEAEQALSMSSDANIDGLREEERWESVKAASISALVGTLAAAPIYLTNLDVTPQLLLHLGITFASCALFGVTFRYAVRRDLDNIQLKTGTAAAFAFVKGLATLSGTSPLELTSASLFSHALDATFFVSQDLLIFVFAAVALDFCFKNRIVSPFPIKIQE
ncbi:hypothetical protein RND81_06G251700 [Saponaria officinalis]|uniref:Homer protein n=1 Tax=Saponaria officinalis TaxID=3572 RepID=A0AAW1KFA6_SAPOF